MDLFDETMLSELNQAFDNAQSKTSEEKPKKASKKKVTATAKDVQSTAMPQNVEEQKTVVETPTNSTQNVEEQKVVVETPANSICNASATDESDGTFDFEECCEDTNPEAQEVVRDKTYFAQLYNKITSLSEETKTSIWNFLETNGFFEDPASAKYHSNFAGGLCEHSIRVAEHLAELTKLNNLEWSHEDSPIIIGLLHDICKTGTYEIYDRNVKDENGKWIKVQCYKNNDKNVMLGVHGDRSVAYLLMLRKSESDFSIDELAGIRWHMGPAQDGDMAYCYEAYRQNPALQFVNVADMMATAEEQTIEY